MTDQVTFDEFLKLDIRVGTICEVNPFPEARKPAYKLLIDFGDELKDEILKLQAQISN